MLSSYFFLRRFHRSQICRQHKTAPGNATRTGNQNSIHCSLFKKNSHYLHALLDSFTRKKSILCYSLTRGYVATAPSRRTKRGQHPENLGNTRPQSISIPRKGAVLSFTKHTVSKTSYSQKYHPLLKMYTPPGDGWRVLRPSHNIVYARGNSSVANLRAWNWLLWAQWFAIDKYPTAWTMNGSLFNQRLHARFRKLPTPAAHHGHRLRG